MAYPGGVLGCSSTPLSRRVAEELCANDCRALVTVNGLVNVQARLLECGGTKLRRNYRRRGCDTIAHAHNGTAARTAPASTALRSEADKLKGRGFDSQRSYFLNCIILVEGSTFWLTKLRWRMLLRFPRSDV